MELRLEGVVDAERVRPLDLLRLGVLDEDPLAGLADGQRLQRPRQLPVGDGGLLLDLVVRVGVSAVEEQQHAHLVPESSKAWHEHDIQGVPCPRRLGFIDLDLGCFTTLFRQ